MIPTLVLPNGTWIEEAYEKATALADISFSGGEEYQGDEEVSAEQGQLVGMMEEDDSRIN